MRAGLHVGRAGASGGGCQMRWIRIRAKAWSGSSPGSSEAGDSSRTFGLLREFARGVK